VGDMLNYLCESRPWCNQTNAIAHNAKAFDLNFILNRTILLKCCPELIMNGQNIMFMSFEYIKFIDRICFLPSHYVNYPTPSVSQPRNPGIRINLTFW
jgi:hypothetical protein